MLYIDWHDACAVCRAGSLCRAIVLDTTVTTSYAFHVFSTEETIHVIVLDTTGMTQTLFERDKAKETRRTR